MRVFVRLYVPIHEHMRLYVLKCACVRLLKCDPDMYAVQYFAEKLLAAVIRCYLRVPCMSKILSQDKKIFAKFRQIFRGREDISEELLESTFTVAENVVYPMIIVWTNFRFHQKFGEIWRFFLSCDKIFDTCETHR